MLSEKLSRKISSVIFDSGLADRIAEWVNESARVKAISRLNPAKIYVENVRTIFGVPAGLAHLILDTGVRKGVFEKGIEILCPDSTVAYLALENVELPEFVTCDIFDGKHYEEQRFATKDLKRREFYRLNYKAPQIVAHS